MKYFEWSDEISINIPEIDEQHKILIGIINDFHDSVQAGYGNEEVNKILTRLILYIQTHFDTEERLMDETQYPGETAHKKEHFNFTEKVGNLYHEQFEGQPTLAFEIMDLLKTWLTDHILKIDKKFGDYLYSRRKLR